MQKSKRIEGLRDTLAAREAEINAQLAACEMQLLETAPRIQAYALRGTEPRFGLSLQWKTHEGEWFLSIRHKANVRQWKEASIEDRTYAIELIDPLLEKLIENATDLAKKIHAEVPEG